MIDKNWEREKKAKGTVGAVLLSPLWVLDSLAMPKRQIANRDSDNDAARQAQRSDRNRGLLAYVGCDKRRGSGDVRRITVCNDSLLRSPRRKPLNGTRSKSPELCSFCNSAAGRGVHQCRQRMPDCGILDRRKRPQDR